MLALINQSGTVPADAQIQARCDGAGAMVVAQRSTAATRTSVASGIASVTILAANTARKGATICNDDANILYLDLTGGTASATGYSVQIPGNGGYYELPFGLTGLLTGIWAADGSGSARVTELT